MKASGSTGAALAAITHEILVAPAGAEHETAPRLIHPVLAQPFDDERRDWNLAPSPCRLGLCELQPAARVMLERGHDPNPTTVKVDVFPSQCPTAWKRNRLAEATFAE